VAGFLTSINHHLNKRVYNVIIRRNIETKVNFVPQSIKNVGIKYVTLYFDRQKHRISVNKTLYSCSYENIILFVSPEGIRIDLFSLERISLWKVAHW